VGDQTLGDAATAFLLVDDGLAELDALAADVDIAGPFDEGPDIAITLAAEGTKGIPVPPGVAGGPTAAVAGTGVFRRHAFSFCRPF
jgi:hypothetical protein